MSLTNLIVSATLAAATPTEQPQNMNTTDHPLEKLVQTITYKGVAFEVVERPDVLWVGCVDYAKNNTDESDIGATLKRYREELIEVKKNDLINPDWSAALSINYGRKDKPCGIMFAAETASREQDERYDVFTQPGGLWLRLRNGKQSAEALLGKEKAAPYEYFKTLRDAAEANGYAQSDVPVEVEYHCHAEYGTPNPTAYAYIPVVKQAEKADTSADAPRFVSLEIETCGPYRFIGKTMYVRGGKSGKLCGALWADYGEWIFATLDGMGDSATEASVYNAALVMWDKYDDKNKLMGYTVGRFMKPGTPVPEDMDFIDIPEGVVAKGIIRGGDDSVAQRMLKEEINRRGTHDAASWIWSAEIYGRPGTPNGDVAGSFIACPPKHKPDAN